MEEKLAYGGIIDILQGPSSKGMAEYCSMTLTWRRKQKWWELFKWRMAMARSHCCNTTLDQTYSKRLHSDTTKRDVVWWIPDKKGKFTVKSCWEAIRNKGAKVPWWKSIWYNNHIPKCAIIQWLACRDRLNAKSRLHKWGMVADQNCILCQDGIETAAHLFFACSYSKKNMESNMQEQ